MGYHGIQTGYHGIQTGYHGIQTGYRRDTTGYHGIQTGYHRISQDTDRIKMGYRWDEGPKAPSIRSYILPSSFFSNHRGGPKAPLPCEARASKACPYILKKLAD